MPDVRRLGTIEPGTPRRDLRRGCEGQAPSRALHLLRLRLRLPAGVRGGMPVGREQVCGVLIFDGQITLPELQTDVVWCALYSVVAPQVTVGEFVAEMQSHEAFDEQLDFLGGYCPQNFERKEWDAVINSTLLQAHFCALAAEQYDPQKLYSGPAFMLSSQDTPAADAAEIDARSFMIKLVATPPPGW